MIIDMLHHSLMQFLAPTLVKMEVSVLLLRPVPAWQDGQEWSVKMVNECLDIQFEYRH